MWIRVTEQEARELCREMAETSPDRETHSWMAREDEDGNWFVVRLAVPPATAPQTTASKPSQSTTARDDPRTAFDQNVPPHGAGF